MTIVALIMYRESKMSLPELYFLAENGYNNESKNFKRNELILIVTYALCWIVLHLMPYLLMMFRLIYCLIENYENSDFFTGDVDQLITDCIEYITVVGCTFGCLIFTTSFIIFIVLARKYHQFEFK